MNHDLIPQRVSSYRHINSRQRVELAALLRVKLKKKDISQQLGKHRSTIYRELKRNKKKDGSNYDSQYARKQTKKRRIKANKRFRKVTNKPSLRKKIIRKLKRHWSPEQIAGKLKTVRHETIYQYIYKHPKLKKYLRCKKGKYRRRYGTRKREKAREEAKKKRIDQRPLIVDQKLRIGDWEGDTIVGTDKSAILTHVERKSGYAIVDKLERLSSEGLADKTIDSFKKLPKSKRQTITYDNGPECWGGEVVEAKLGIDVYYAHPYHSWERGCNENFNGLLREFFPKKTSFANVKQEDIKRAVRLLNTRPRKRLNYLTPAEVFKKKCCTLD